MPRYVDHDQRRRDIVEAACMQLGEEGLNGFSLRAVAARLGGSVTLVTHYYTSRQELLDELASSMMEWWDRDIAAMDADIADPYERLRAFLTWMLPLTPEDRVVERGRIHLLAEQQGSKSTQPIFDTWDARIRGFLADHLRDLVPSDELDITVDVLRSITNGLVLSMIEHPDKWPSDRMLRVLEESLVRLGLVPAAAETGARGD